MNETVYAVQTSKISTLCWSIKQLPERYRQWRTERMLKKIVQWSDSNYLSHAIQELPGCRPGADEMDALMAQQVIELLAVFASHGHSGFSAPYAVGIFSKLAAFEPLGPLTGEDDEWERVADDLWQNKRCSHVFKGADGQAYDIYGQIFREPGGCCYTGSGSSVDIEFPYTPSSEYVDVKE